MQSYVWPWGHKAFTKKNLQTISSLIHSAAHIAVNLRRSTPLQIMYQLTNIPPPKLHLERQIALRLNSLLVQPHKKTQKLLVLQTPTATHSKSHIKKFKLYHGPTPKLFPSLPHPSVLHDVFIKTHFDQFQNQNIKL